MGYVGWGDGYGIEYYSYECSCGFELAFAHKGSICPGCGKEITEESPDDL